MDKKIKMVHGFTGSRVHGFTGSRVHGFTGELCLKIVLISIFLFFQLSFFHIKFFVCEARADTIAINEANFPDANFRTYVKSSLADNRETINTDTVKAIGVASKGIKDLTGIKKFTNLEELVCNNNQITELDLSGLNKLKALNCANNQITNINISGCSALPPFTKEGNPFKVLNASGCTSITAIGFDENAKFEDVNFSGCTNLNNFSFSRANLISLDFSDCTSLKMGLGVNDSPNLAMLNLKGCTGITELSTPNANLVVLNLNGCTQIPAVSISSKKLEVLDVTNCEKITDISITDAKLKSLKITGCKNLKTIACNKNNLTELDVSNLTALETLNCSENELEKLDVSGSTSLKNLYCNDNGKISELKLSGLTALEILYCGVNNLKELDVSNLKNLKELYCNENKGMKTLNVKGCEALEIINCGNDDFKELDVSDLTKLKTLLCPNNITNSMTSLNIKGCGALVTLDCRGQKIKNLETSSCEELKTLSCDLNEITTLDLSKNKKLGTLSCRSNKFTNLDISALTDLTFFDCRNNFLRDLDASKCAALKYLYCSGQITDGLSVTGTGSPDIPYQASLKSFVKNTGDILNVQGFISASDIFSASYEASTGIANFPRKPSKVIYNVRTKSGSLNVLMDVTIEDLDITEFVPNNTTSRSVSSSDINSQDQNQNINLNQNNSNDNYSDYGDDDYDYYSESEDITVNNENRAVITEDLAAALQSRDIDYASLEYDEMGIEPSDVSEILNQTSTPVISSVDVIVDSIDNASALAFATDAPADTVFYVWLIDPSSLGFTGYNAWPDDGKQNGKEYHVPTRLNGILFYGPFLGVVKNGSIGVDVKNLYYAEDVGDYTKQSKGLIPAISAVFLFKNAALNATNFSAAALSGETFRSQVLFLSASLSVSELAEFEKNNSSTSQEQNTSGGASGCNSGSYFLIFVLFMFIFKNYKKFKNF